MRRHTAPDSLDQAPALRAQVFRDPILFERSLGVVLWLGLIVVLLTKSSF